MSFDLQDEEKNSEDVRPNDFEPDALEEMLDMDPPPGDPPPIPSADIRSID